MHIQILSIILFTLLSLPLAILAKNLPQTEQGLSLEQAVVIGLKNNPSLNQQVNTVQSAEITVSQQRADFYPDLTLEASGSKRFDNSPETITGSAENRDVTAVGVELSSTVNLFNGFADIAALKNAELLLEVELESLSQEEQTLMFETISQFIQVLTDQELIAVEAANMEENKKLLERIETFYQAGKLPVSDLYQQQAETKQAELDLLEAQHTLNASKLLLMQTMGMNPTIHYQVTSPVFEKLHFQVPAGDTDKLALHALENRSDIQAQERQVKAAEQQIRLTKADRLPKIDLFANIATNYSSISEEEQFSDQFNEFLDEFMDDNLSSTIGVTFSIPLFDRFETSNNTVKAQIEKRNEQLTLQEKKLQVGLEVAQAIQDLRKTQKQIDVVESKLTHAHRALQSYKERYRVGASTLVELIQARTQYVTAAFERVEAKYDLVTQEISVAYYLGDLDRMFAALSVEEMR